MTGRTIKSRRATAMRALCCLVLALLFAIATISAYAKAPAFAGIVAIAFLLASVWNLLDAAFLDEISEDATL